VGLGTKRKPCPNSVPKDVEGFEVVCIGGRLSIDGQGHVPDGDCTDGTVSAFPALEAWIGSWVGSPRRLVSIEAIAHILGPAFEWAVYGSLLRSAWADGLNSIGDEDDAEALVGAVTAAVGL